MTKYISTDKTMIDCFKTPTYDPNYFAYVTGNINILGLVKFTQL